MYAGPDVKYTRTPRQSTFIGTTEPYGSGDFGQVGVKAGFDLDTRGRRIAGTTTGDQFRAGGKPHGDRRAPEGRRRSTTRRRGTRSGFGGVEGSLRGYLAGRSAMLAARVGGRRVWGEYPWFEAAFVGGSKNLRGYRKNRFAGDASLYGASRLRLWLFRGAADRARALGTLRLRRTSAASPSRARPPTSGTRRDGGGIFFQMLTLDSIVHAAMAWSEEDRRLYVSYGFAF